MPNVANNVTSQINKGKLIKKQKPEDVSCNFYKKLIALSMENVKLNAFYTVLI